ncbi:MAG: carbohydrate ABC transporter permease [Spirochaetales bacterium]|nr:carbohydrate ABC transporter permease [Spirochaetales bacterium]MBP7262842.1 carbohydrate ABC transporter permease [Spirochaetia bacterium]
MISRHRLGLGLSRTAVYAVFTFFAMLAVVPIYLMLINATRSTEAIQQGLSLLPGNQIAHNWKALTNRGFNITRGFFNSAFIALATTAVAVYFSAMTAYGLHVFQFRGKKVLWSVILVVIMVPPQLGLIGFYRMMAQLKLLDSFVPLILPAMASPATVLFIRQYLKSVLSLELVEAARMDGASEFRIFNTIVTPVIAPAMATMAIFSFVGSWNNFITPYILLSDKDKYTLPMLVQLLRTDIYRTEYGGIYLGIAVSIVPILVFYAFMSRHIIAGITIGGVKE